jgi:hypothetical protein
MGMQRQPMATDRAHWLWPAIILVSAAVTGYLAFAQVDSVLRPVVTLGFLLVCPGMTFVRLLRIRERMTELTLAITLSLALNTLLIVIMLYAGIWAPYTGLLIIICLSVGGVTLQMALAAFQKIDSQTFLACGVFMIGVMLALFALIEPILPTHAPLEATPARGGTPTATAEAPGRRSSEVRTTALGARPTPQLPRTALEVTATVLLVALIIQKEIARVVNSPRSQHWVQALNVAIVPLLFVFGFVIAMRLLHWMHLL